MDATASAVSATKTATSLSRSLTVGAGSNRLLIVGVSLVKSGSTYVTGVTYGSAALTRVGTRSITVSGYSYITEMWALVAPASGSNVITVNAYSAASIVFGAVSFSGADLSAPLGTFVSGSNANSSPATVTAATLSTDLVVDAVTQKGDGKLTTPGTGQTIRWNPKPGGRSGWARGEGSTKAGASGSTTLSWSGGKSIWSMGAVPVHAALNPPAVAKAFSPAYIPVNGYTSLTVTLTNPNAAAITGAVITDNYPSANLKNTASAPASNTCGGTVTMAAGGSSFALSGGYIPASGSCSVAVQVTAAAAGSYANYTAPFSGANTLPGPAASATLTVLNPPLAAKSFSPGTISVNGSSTMTITLTNTNAVPVTGAAFTDAYPSSNLRNVSAAPTANTCGGAVTMASGGSSLALSGGTIPAGGSCVLTVPVTALAAGTYNNNTGAIATGNAGPGSAAAAALTVVSAPSAAKFFSPAVIPAVSGISSMTITLINTNGSAVGGVALTDNYPSPNMQNTAGAPLSNTCGGAVTMAAGGSSLAISGGSIAASNSCSIVVTVKAAAAGTYVNNTGAASYSTPASGVFAAASAQLTGMAPPAVAKAFSPAVIPVAGTSNLTITLTNPNPADISGAAFTDNYPSANLQNAAGSPLFNTCGGAVTMARGGSSLALSGAVIPASGSCSITVPVTAAAMGVYNNTTGPLVTSNSGTGAAAAAALTAMAPPASAKAFSPATILPGAASAMTITLTNPNAAPVTGAAFTDAYPAGMTNTAGVPTSNTCGGAAAMSNGGSSLSLSGGTIPGSGSCSLVVPVTGVIPGDAENETSAIDTANAGQGPAAMGTLSVISPPIISKTFSPAVILPNGAVSITFDLSDSNAFSITGAAFTDTYPAGMKNTAGTPASNTCGGTVTMTNGGASFAVSGMTIPTAGCSIVVPVTAAPAGTYVNNTGAVTSSNAGTGDPDSDTLRVMTAAGSAKQFDPPVITQNGSALLTITLNNPNATAITGAAFTDNYPANLLNSAGAAPSTDCGGTVTAADGGSSLALSGGTIPGAGSCMVTVSVTSSLSGTYLNNTGTISTNSGNIASSNATLTVQTPARIALNKTADPAVAPPGTTLLYTIYYRNTGQQPASNLLISDSIPPNTTYVAGSLKRGSAASSYASAAALTDAADGDAGSISGTDLVFSVGTVTEDDGAANSGSDEGKVYYKVTIN